MNVRKESERMKKILAVIASLALWEALAEYSVEWSWDVEPPRRVSSGQSFKIAGHWTVAYSSSSGSVRKRLSAIWKIRSGSGQKLSGGTFVANTSLTLWGSATSPSTEVPDLSKIVTISVNSSSSGGTTTPTTSNLDSTYYCPAPLVLQGALDSLPESGLSNQIEEVFAKSRYPWEGLVDVRCSVTGNVDVANAHLVLMGENSGQPLPVKTVAGDFIASAGEHRFIWDANKDMNGINAAKAKITVGVAKGSPAYSVLAKKPKYVVVDLSGGTNSCYYPISAMSEIPAGGWGDEFKTSKILLQRVEPGSFLMGDGSTEELLKKYGREVTLTKPFYLGVFEVTQRQWELVAGTRPSEYTNSTSYATRPVDSLTYNAIRGSNIGNSWPESSGVDTNSFMGVLRLKTGVAEFDLPTDAQWEYACRAGTSTRMYDGTTGVTDEYIMSRPSKLGRSYIYVKTNERNVAASDGGTAIVGSYPANPWGFYDLYGNVAELVRDWYIDVLGTDAVTDPKGPGKNEYTQYNSKTGKRTAVYMHIVRGGGCGGSETEFVDTFTSGNRVRVINESVDMELSSVCGFRISLDVEE